MPDRKTTRIYTRSRGGQTRYYGDFRAFADVGGGREALAPDGQKRATTDPSVAAKLYAERLQELEGKRKNRHLHGVERESDLKPYAAYHLRQKARDGEATKRWLKTAETHLRAAVDFFGPTTDLAAIGPEECGRWVDHLRRQPNGRGGTLSDSTVRKYLNSLSNLYVRAVSERYVRSNPVGDMYRKPTESRREAEYLEPEAAALLLEAARTYKPSVSDRAFPYIYPLLATFLLTGGRKSEVLGLEVDDVSLRLGKVYFRPNDWRRLKTRRSKRSVPLWPQLEELLRAYLVERERTGGLGRLLFPSARGTGEAMIHDLRKALDRIGKRAGFAEGEIRLHRLRHTYTAARIQTTDRGRPVALYTVARELGHASTDQIADRYGHLHDRAEEVALDIRRLEEALLDAPEEERATIAAQLEELRGRAEVVSYYVSDYRTKLGDRLTALERLAATSEEGAETV